MLPRFICHPLVTLREQNNKSHRHLDKNWQISRERLDSWAAGEVSDNE